MRPPTTLRLLAAGAMAATLAAIPSAAGADTTSTTASPAATDRLAYCKGRAGAEIQMRLTKLTEDLNLVNSATHLTAGDKQSLVTLITGDQSGLGQLKTTIDGTTDANTCRTDAMNIVTNYRIYVLVGPKIHLTIAADRAEAVGGAFQEVSAKLQAAINTAKANGKQVVDAQRDLDALNAKVTMALDTAGPVPGQVLPLQPSGYPGNLATLTAARQSLRTARDDFNAARADAQRVRVDLS